MAREDALSVCIELMTSMLNERMKSQVRKLAIGLILRWTPDPRLLTALLDLIQAAQSVYSEFCPIL
jgi:hypothetical protein